MLNLCLPIRVFRAILILTLVTLSSPAFSFEADISVSAKSIMFTTSGAEVKYISVTVVSSMGEVVFSQTATSSVTWNLAAKAKDGHYKYEVKLSNIAAGSRTRGANDDNTDIEVSTQSGSALIQAGSFVIPTREETGLWSPLQSALGNIASTLLNFLVSEAKADILQQDDVISSSSHCIGNDCVNGENFESDTLRLKENNLRIHFQDTSSSASFPTNDWRIIVNDSTNGGANYFGVEDSTNGRMIMSLEAGAPASAFVIDSNGRLGLGTSNPLTAIEASTGNNPILRLNQNGTQGFASQSWDIGGNETSFFVRDFTNGETLPFKIETGAPTDSFSINSVGNVGFGVENPTEKLHVVGNAIISGNLELGSSRTIKHAIENLDLKEALTALTGLEPVTYHYNHSPDQQSLGFIAEDVPDLVASQGRNSIKPMDIVTVLTKVVQEQQKTIEQLSEKLDDILAKQSITKNNN